MKKRSKSARVEGLESRQLLSAVPTPAHIVIVIDENKNFGQVIGNPDAAYINSLANAGAVFTNSHGIAHPSQPNYLALFSGSTQGVVDDNGPVAFNGPDLASELIAKGLGFGGYSGDLPSVGSQVLTYADYAKKHNAWSDFSDVPASANMPLTSFPTDYTQLPTVSVVIPDLDDDMHDGTVADGDAFMQQNLAAYATWAKANNSLLIFTFDEDDDTDATNQIPTVFYGANVVTGNYSENINHYNVLRTIEDMYGLAPLGNSASTGAITDVWNAGGTNPTTTNTSLSTLTWTSATTGYGTIHKDADINGTQITLRGKTYLNGIGTHAASTITYNLNGAYNEFTSDVGVDDDVNSKGVGSVDFKVLGDGKTLYDSGIVTNNSPIAHLDVNVAGVKTLTLIATNGVANSIDYDHADWAGATLIQPAPTPTAPTAPTNLSAAVASSTELDLSWTTTSNNQTGFELDRSADGVNFTSIAQLNASATTYADTGLTGGAKYYYRVLATNSLGASPASNIASATTLAAGTVQVYVSDLAWTSATSGYKTVQKDKNINGATITLRGKTYAKGLGTHAASTITYNLGGAYTTFTSDVGIDDEVTGQGSVDFTVVGDGKTLFDSGKVTGASAVVHINISVTGVKTLSLIATNGIANVIDYDHADWAGAQLLGVPSAPAAPSALTATGVSQSEIDLRWTNNASNQSSFEIDRSLDGATFNVLSTIAGTSTTYADTGLATGKSYFYRVEAINTNGTSPSSNVASSATFSTTPVTTYLSALTWASATTGYGTVHKDASINGNPIILNGTTYTKGIGTHAASTITYNLAGGYTSFITDVGLDDEVGDEGSVDFTILGDGVKLFDSGIMTGNTPTMTANVNVTGVKTLTITATNSIAGAIDFDHADWANARLLGAPSAPAAPTNVVAIPLSSSQVSLTWTAGSGNQTSYQIERSIAGGAFSVLTTVAGTATLYADSGLTANTSYTYRLEAINAIGSSPASTTATVLTMSASSTTTYLSDLTWTSATTGYGTVQKNLSIKGNAITLRGTKYTKGIGTHANSTITYNIAGKYKTFQTDFGIDDEVNGQGSVTFQVLGDGKSLYKSGTITGASAVGSINVSVVGVKSLQLVVTTTTTGVIDFDHSDWANARLLT